MAARTRSVQRLALLLLLSVAITAQASAFYLPQQPEEDTPVALQRAKRCLFGGWACKSAGGPVSPANPPPGPGMGPYPGPGMGPYPGPGMGPNPGPGMGPNPGPGMGPNPGPGAGAGPNPGYGPWYYQQPVYKPNNHFYQPNSINNQENSHNYQPTFG